MRIPLLVLFLLCFSQMHSEIEEPYLNDQKVVAHQLQGVIISGDHFYPPDYILNTTKGVLFYRTAAPKSARAQETFCKQMESQFAGKVVTQANLKQWKEEIANYFLEHCNAYVFVEEMAGAKDSSIIVLKVMESKIGEVFVSGNRWFSDEYYRRNMGLFPEGEVDTKRITADLDVLNRNPLVKAELAFHKEAGDRINVELKVEDEKPFSASTGVDNQMVDVLGVARMYGKASWQSGGALPKTFSVEYQTSNELEQLQRVLVDADIPSKYGSVGLAADGALISLDQMGYYLSLEQQFGYALLQRRTVERGFSLSLKQKAMNNALLEGEEKFGSSAVIAGVELGFSGRVEKENYSFDGSIKVFSQPFAFSPLMSKDHYHTLREGAATRFSVGRARCNFLLNSPSMPTLLVQGGVQLSFDRLLPTEQLGLGGEGSVRGYAQHAMNADSAATLSVEARSAKISLLRFLGPKYRKMDAFYGVFFVDSAEAFLTAGEREEGRSLFMLGMGPGFRYDILDMLHASVDLGLRLGRLPLDVDGARARLYFSVAATY